ncbi:MAG: transposase [Proteobacteria bacterium]|nr:transposase [Pseudomonadota bacterium]
MAIARSEVVAQGVEAYYHCISRCVRQSFLCGVDTHTGRSFEHRKAWIQARLKDIGAAFGIDVVTYAVMSNHLHVVLRTRPDRVDGWSAEETAERWLTLFPMERDEAGRAKAPSRSAIDALARQDGRLIEIRSRLGSVSWFMRCLNEYVARMANREEGCKGRFWEGRFKCQALLDDAALLACMTYVDLNPIRAGVADTPERSEYTGIFDRIQARTSGAEETWICPLGGEAHGDPRGVLPFTLDEYLSLTDWTGREIRLGKRGVIPAHLSDILDRIPLNQARWLDTVQGYGGLFHRVVGRMGAMMDAARLLGKNWLGGIRAGQAAFSTG